MRDEHGEFSGAERHQPAQLWQQHGDQAQALVDNGPYSLRNYLYQLQEQLGYVLTNLDSENMSENFLSSKGETE